MNKKSYGRRKQKTASRRNKKKKHKESVGSFWLFIVTRVFAALVFVFVLLLVYFDYEIQQRLAGNIQSEPAHVYAHPLELSAGSTIDSTRLIKSLDRLGYRHTKRIAEPGEYARSSSAIDIFIRAVDDDDDPSPPQAVRLVTQNNKVIKLIDHNTGNNLQSAVLEPALIGSLQLGSYKDRISLKLHQMPELLIQSLLAMEDRNFQTHIGIDPTAIARAIWLNLKEGRAIQGGSTITQQLVKNLFLSPERTFGRKITEAMMSLVLEIRFSKAEILELYLNEIFFGQSGNRAVHGFALASEYFFGRQVGDLKLHETALLVGMIPAPSYYNPHRYPERAIKRRNLVVKRLVDVGAISQYTAQSVYNRPIGVIPHSSESSSDFPAYIDYLHRQLRQYYSEEVLTTNGLKLYTSLDSQIQRVAQSTLTQTLGTLEESKGFPKGTLQGAVIVVAPKSGEILALVGDRKKGYSPDFDGSPHADRPQPNKHAGVVEKLLCSAYLNICVDFGNSMV